MFPRSPQAARTVLQLQEVPRDPRHHPRSTVRHKGIGKDDEWCNSHQLDGNRQCFEPLIPTVFCSPPQCLTTRQVPTDPPAINASASKTRRRSDTEICSFHALCKIRGTTREETPWRRRFTVAADHHDRKTRQRTPAVTTPVPHPSLLFRRSSGTAANARPLRPVPRPVH